MRFDICKYLVDQDSALSGRWCHVVLYIPKVDGGEVRHAAGGEALIARKRGNAAYAEKLESLKSAWYKSQGVKAGGPLSYEKHAPDHIKEEHLANAALGTLLLGWRNFTRDYSEDLALKLMLSSEPFLRFVHREAEADYGFTPAALGIPVNETNIAEAPKRKPGPQSD